MSFVDSKYIGLVSSRLDKFAKKKEGLYNFRCPYCGDSQRTKSKTRGYIYQLKNDHNFKCHNCGTSRTFTNFLKDMDTVLYDQYVMERYKEGTTGRGSQTKTPEFNFEKPNFLACFDENYTVQALALIESIEKTNLEAHVDLCAQRYDSLDKRLVSIETEIGSLKKLIQDGQASMTKVMIGTAGTIVTGVLSLIVVVLQK